MPDKNVNQSIVFQKSNEIILAGQFLYQQGWSPATSSNYSARIDSKHIAITSSGKHKGKLSNNDIMVRSSDKGSTKTFRWDLITYKSVYTFSWNRRGITYPLTSSNGIKPLFIRTKRTNTRRLRTPESDCRPNDTWYTFGYPYFWKHTRYCKPSSWNQNLFWTTPSSTCLLNSWAWFIYLGKRYDGMPTSHRSTRVFNSVWTWTY